MQMLLTPEEKIIEQLRTENAALKADNELLRSLSFRDERDALKERVAYLEELNRKLCDKANQLTIMNARAEETIAQQAAVIEQIREALYLLLLLDNDHQRQDDEDVCYEVQKAREAIALQPSPEILEARDERIAEACAKVVIADNGQCDSHVIASQLVCGEWRKHI